MTLNFYTGFMKKRHVQKLNPGQYSLAISEAFFQVITWHQKEHYKFSFF
jgi:hypothetical protein